MRLLCKELKVWSHEELLAIFASFMYTRIRVCYYEPAK